MASKLKILLGGILMTLLLQDCTQNDGYIGSIFGIWILDEMTIDGKPSELNVQDYTWRFQNNIVQITHQLPYHDFIVYTGTWERIEGELVLNFEHNLGGKVPEELEMQPNSVTSLKILHESNKSMQLEFENSNNNKVVYVLRKIN